MNQRHAAALLKHLLERACMSIMFTALPAVSNLMRFGLLMLGCFTLSSLALIVHPNSNGIGSFSLGAVLAFAVLIRQKPADHGRNLAALFAGMCCARWLAGFSFGIGMGLASATLISVLAGTTLLRHARLPSIFDLKSALLMLGMFMLIVTPLHALASAAVRWFDNGMPPTATFIKVWRSEALSATLVLLPMLILRKSDVTRALPWRLALEMIIAVPAALLTTYLLLHHFPYPFVYILFVFTVVALRYGAFYCGVVALLVITSMTLFAVQGFQPLPDAILAHGLTALWGMIGFTALFPLLAGIVADQFRQRNEALAVSDARFRGALRFAATGFVLTDAQSCLTEVNPRFCRMLGYSAEELAQLRLLDLAHPDDRKMLRSSLDNLIRGAAIVQELELRYVHKSGRFIWTSLKASRMEHHGPPDAAQGDAFIMQIDDITARKASQEAMRAKERRLQLALEAAQGGTWEWDASTDITWWADQVYRIYGFEPGQVEPCPANWLAALYKEDRVLASQCRQAAIEAKRGYEQTYRVLAPDGSLRWVHECARAEIDDKGELIRLYGVSLDITQRKTSEARFRALVENAPDTIFAIDAQGRIQLLSNHAQALFGYPPRELIGQPLARLFPGQIHPHRLDSAERRLVSPDGHNLPPTLELQARRADGSELPVDMAQGFLPGDDQLRVIAIVRDITQHKQAQAALLQARGQLQSVINAASEFSIITVDPQGTITLFNTGAERMLGYRAEEMIGRHTPLLIHVPAEIEARAVALSEQLGRPISGFEVFGERARHGLYEAQEWTYVRKDGSHLTVNLVVTAIRDSAGEISGFLGIANDVTVQHQTRQKLALAKEQAESASRAKSEFLANMSHEIRTPLNAVLGMAHLLGTTPLGTDQKNYLNMINVSGRSLLGILNDILDFSKIEAGRMEIVRNEFFLNDIVDALAAIMSVNVAEKELELLIDIQPDVPRHLIGDTQRLQQVLINLTGNAIKFTLQGEVGVSIQLMQWQGETALLRFTVSDTGVGISQPQAERLFAAFSQADNSVTRRFGGTGLGLVISKRLVQLMGGEIGVDSELGRGSRFWFTVPFEVGTQKAAAALPGPQEKLQVLIVDDNAHSRQSIATIVHSFGWEATCLANGFEAVTLLRSRAGTAEAFDLMLLDWRMPVFNGEQTLEALARYLDEALPLTIVMTTAYGREEVVRSASANRIDAVLNKPVTGSALFNALVEARIKRSGGDTNLLSVTDQGALLHRLDGVRLLVVEDNAFNQTIARGILEGAGALLDVVDDGQQAVDRLRARPQAYDVVLMDVQMPVMDGYTATRAIRQELGLHKLPIIAVSAGVMQSERDQCIDSGMNDFISKPLEVERTLMLIHQYVRRSTLTIEAPELATAVDLNLSNPNLSAREPGTQASTLAGLSLQAALSRLSGNRVLLRRLIEKFADDLERLPAELNRLLATHSYKDSARLAHTLKGNAAVFDGHDIVNAAMQLEQAVLAADHPAIEGALANLRGIAIERLPALRRWLQASTDNTAHSIAASLGAEAD